MPTLEETLFDLAGPMFVGEPDNDVSVDPDVANRVSAFLALAQQMVPLMWSDPAEVAELVGSMSSVTAWKSQYFGGGEPIRTDPQRVLLALVNRAVATLPW